MAHAGRADPMERNEMRRMTDNRVWLHGRALLAMIHDRLPGRPEAARQGVRAGQDPTSSITSLHDAIVIAEALLKPVRRRDDDALWRTIALPPLTALLYAASPEGNGGGIGWVDLALDNVDPDPAAPGWYQAAEIYCAAGAANSADPLLARLNHLRGGWSNRQRASICYTMRAAIAPWLPRDPINGIAALRAS
jgi:type IV secretion system protein VirD4